MADGRFPASADASHVGSGADLVSAKDTDVTGRTGSVRQPLTTVKAYSGSKTPSGPKPSSTYGTWTRVYPSDDIGYGDGCELKAKVLIWAIRYDDAVNKFGNATVFSYRHYKQLRQFKSPPPSDPNDSNVDIWIVFCK